jgi:tetratricopeptide (TPR) repeat protein
LGILYNGLGQYEKAAEVLREAMRVGGGAIVQPYGNLAVAYLGLNRFAEARALLEQSIAKFDAPQDRRELYRLAWIEGDTAAMERQAEWFRGKPQEYWIVGLQATTAALGGQLQTSRELNRRAVEMARRAGLSEQAASVLAAQALREALVGHFPLTREAAARSLDLARDWDNVPVVAVALALAGSAGPAQALLEEVTKRYPQDTLLKNVSVPSVQAAAEISRGNARRAVELLESAAAYELGGPCCVLYLRGQAYLRAGGGKEAAAAFQKILDHRGVFARMIEYPLAHLGLARSQALAGNTAEARKAYQDFLALWKDADPDIPILKEAEAEYARLK